jgi:hypothetical protein
MLSGNGPDRLAFLAKVAENKKGELSITGYCSKGRMHYAVMVFVGTDAPIAEGRGRSLTEALDQAYLGYLKAQAKLRRD